VLHAKGRNPHWRGGDHPGTHHPRIHAWQRIKETVGGAARWHRAAARARKSGAASTKAAEVPTKAAGRSKAATARKSKSEK
jgi:hypothetical protein